MSASGRTGRCKKVYGMYLVFALMHKGYIIANLLALPRASEGFPPSDTAPLSLFVKGASPPFTPAIEETQQTAKPQFTHFSCDSAYAAPLYGGLWGEIV